MADQEETYIGTVIWFNNTFGFISWDKAGKPQKDLFVHFSGINSQGYRSVKKGEKVSFTLGTNNRGQLIATNVTVVL